MVPLMVVKNNREDGEGLKNNGDAREDPNRGLVIHETEAVGDRHPSKQSNARAAANASWPAIDSLPELIQAGNIQRIVIPQEDYESKCQDLHMRKMISGGCEKDGLYYLYYGAPNSFTIATAISSVTPF
ncbi:uncharacterized protein LOC122078780 [Macadamia integrifolia]|uniref:uncharacterized protein LOC122078780 n=1 Tax=Macadamia integrifolia TaxID=60698 RepID=UPI001C5022DC|nr:uncharacterized protein LOC122078780 [Macadamia integrifolia]